MSQYSIFDKKTRTNIGKKKQLYIIEITRRQEWNKKYQIMSTVLDYSNKTRKNSKIMNKLCWMNKTCWAYMKESAVIQFSNWKIKWWV